MIGVTSWTINSSSGDRGPPSAGIDWPTLQPITKAIAVVRISKAVGFVIAANQLGNFELQSLSLSINHQLSTINLSKQLRRQEVGEFLDGVGLVAVGDEEGVAGLDDDEVIDA